MTGQLVEKGRAVSAATCAAIVEVEAMTARRRRRLLSRLRRWLARLPLLDLGGGP